MRRGTGCCWSRLAREIALLILLATVPAVLAALVHPRRPSMQDAGARVPEVTLEAVRGWGESPVWVDARPAADYGEDHVPGAVSLNEDDWDGLLPGFLDAWRPGARVVVYCGGGDCRSSQEVARRLREEVGIVDGVRVLRGGWDAWRRARE